MREFSTVYHKTFEEASTHQIIAIMGKFVKHNWMIAQTYNGLIEAFGKHFNDFSFRELASFTSSLAKVGLRQGDIISESIDRLVSGAGKKIEEDTSVKTSNQDNYSVAFKTVILPIFEGITQLDLPQ